MRSMQFLAVPLLAAVLAGCGGSSGSTPDRSAAPSASMQSLESWYTEAFIPVDVLSAAYTSLGDASASGAVLHGRPEVAELRSAAKAGLLIPAPAGHPDIDTGYDRVMTDALTVAGDIDSGSDRFLTDSLKASNDMDDLKELLNRTP